MKKIILIFCAVFSTSALCSDCGPTIASVSNVLFEGVDIVTRFMHVICIVVGAMLLVMSITFYAAHRHNPKYVPLDRPVAYLVLALIIMSIPFWSKFAGKTLSTVDMKEKQEKPIKLYDIDAPTKRVPKINVPQKGTAVYDIDAPLEWADED